MYTTLREHRQRLDAFLASLARRKEAELTCYDAGAFDPRRWPPTSICGRDAIGEGSKKPNEPFALCMAPQSAGYLYYQPSTVTLLGHLCNRKRLSRAYKPHEDSAVPMLNAFQAPALTRTSAISADSYRCVKGNDAGPFDEEDVACCPF